jgi:hypothetical protein
MFINCVYNIGQIRSEFICEKNILMCNAILDNIIYEQLYLRRIIHTATSETFLLAFVSLRTFRI